VRVRLDSEHDVRIRCPVERALFLTLCSWQPPDARGPLGILERVRWYLGDGGEPFHNTDLFLDRSALDVALVFGIAGAVPRALGAPLLGLHQSVDGAEVLAVYVALRHSRAPITLHGDSAFVVDGLLQRVPAATTAICAAWAISGPWFGARSRTSVASALREALSKRSRRIPGRRQRPAAGLLRSSAVGTSRPTGGPKTITAQFSLTARERGRAMRGQLLFNGTPRWLGHAGSTAAAARDDVDHGVRIVQAQEPQLAVSAHDPMSEGGRWRCLRCREVAGTECSKRQLFA
ncbi:unnamed protein product, partial [Prorocentrum cordatum]